MAGASRQRALVDKFARVRVLVVGDLIADEFVYGRVSRVSREAPVLILEYVSSDVLPGGAGNAAANAAALGARVRVAGVVGTDDPGSRLIEAMADHADTEAIVRAARYDTPIKTRILAGGVHSAKQQVVRLDRTANRITPALRRRLLESLTAAVAGVDAVIVSDYGTGLITPELIQAALTATGSRRGRAGRKPLVFVDSRYALAGYAGVTACTPNESEVEALLGVTIGDNLQALERAGRHLLSSLESRAVLITRGSRGMALFEPGRHTEHIPIVGSDEIADVTGAGDTVIATFAIARAAGATFSDAAHLANHAAGIVVMKRGTATATAAELLTSTSSSRVTRSVKAPARSTRGTRR